MGNQQQTCSEADLGWTAGILDGEGSILLFLGVRKAGKINNVSPQVILGNTDKMMIENYVRILSQIGAGVHVSERIPKKGGVEGMTAKQAKKYKLLHIASTVGFQRVQTLLRPLIPHLVSKREKAEIILKFIDQRLAKLRIVSADGRGKYSNRPYSREDYELMFEIMSMQHSKHTHIIEGMLRDYTRSAAA